MKIHAEPLPWRTSGPHESSTKSAVRPNPMNHPHNRPMTGTRRPPFPHSGERLDPMTVQGRRGPHDSSGGRVDPLQNPGTGEPLAESRRPPSGGPPPSCSGLLPVQTEEIPGTGGGRSKRNLGRHYPSRSRAAPGRGKRERGRRILSRVFPPRRKRLDEARRPESMEKLTGPRQDRENGPGEGGKRGQTFRTFPPKKRGGSGQGWSRFRTFGRPAKRKNKNAEQDGKTLPRIAP